MTTLIKPSFLNAKSTLRELVKDQKLKSYEFDLNPIRSNMYKYGWDIETTFDNKQKYNQFLAPKGYFMRLDNWSRLEFLRNSAYLKKTSCN